MDELGQIIPPDWCRSPGKMSQCLERRHPHGPTPHGVLQALISVTSNSQHCFHPRKRHLPLARTTSPTATLSDRLERSELSATRGEMCCSRTEPAAPSSTGGILTAVRLRGTSPRANRVPPRYKLHGCRSRMVAGREEKQNRDLLGGMGLLVNRAGRL